jgi:hypothetical protein
MVNGPAWKALIEEEFGDGIMSRIHFDMQMDRLPNLKSDCVKIRCREIPVLLRSYFARLARHFMTALGR